MATDTDDLLEIAKSKKSQISKRKLYDRIARYVIMFGGIAIILSIITMLFFIGIETVPLWQSPQRELINSANIIESNPETQVFSPILGIGAEEYREKGFVIDTKGNVKFLTFSDLKFNEIKNLDVPGALEYTYLYNSKHNVSYAVSTDNGFIKPFETKYKIEFDNNGKRIITPNIIHSEAIKISESKIDFFAFKTDEDSGKKVAAVYTGNKELLLFSEEETESFTGEIEIKKTILDLTNKHNNSTITAVQIDDSLNNLYVANSRGDIFTWSISNLSDPTLKSVVNATERKDTGITTLGFLLGSRSLIVGDEKGNVSIWFETRDESNKRVLTKIHQLPPLAKEIVQFSNSPRDRGFIASDAKGNIGLYHATSETKQLEILGEGNRYSGIAFTPKANGIIALDNNGEVRNYFVDNPHPETNFKTLFGKVWYEGYEKPTYSWQSTGGTDEFEPKLSLTPLVYGSLKGAIYALLIAIPLAIMGAICVSQFIHPSTRNIIKPVIEIMAALPSVVLGFFAGLWLAPLLEKIFTAVLIMPILITLFTFLMLYFWNKLPLNFTGRFRVGSELFLLVFVIVISIIISLMLNSPVESLIFGGDFKNWFYTVLGLQYDQRNSLIVGFAMGFAVIPIIFTISEDALSSIPKNLTSGSLALGANRWQTAIKIVLPSASAGIFSAIMIGFGRAVGETMIVLMATGNTPVMDWSFFNGFRALSANIAVELPEAPHGGTLYRVLFLSALLLFGLTFILNTLAEIIRSRLRKKYGQLNA
ncbi:MAG: ABC transporter permease subunit [Candidatus Dadabacteria bacterium]|nr:ABC transporter permease subunit [Candidatus Dadabacteria bacterium]NIQ15848.1 ABC transporter permease subunit [Candidatus Dadabacteria bacterium]